MPGCRRRGCSRQRGASGPCGAQDPNPPADALQGAITHDFQTEGYYIISGAAPRSSMASSSTAGRARTTPTADRTVRAAAAAWRLAARKVELKVGDVLIVPPGVIHGWFDIPDHVDYLSFRPSHGIMKNGWVNPTIATK
jgi:hypothetical protein